MSHFAKIESGVVTQVIVAEQDFVDTLNETTCLWEPPVVYPSDDKMYTWDEDTTSWVEET